MSHAWWRARLAQAQNLAREADPLMQCVFVAEIRSRYLLDQLVWIDEVRRVVVAGCPLPTCRGGWPDRHMAVPLAFRRSRRSPWTTASLAAATAGRSAATRAGAAGFGTRGSTTLLSVYSGSAA